MFLQLWLELWVDPLVSSNFVVVAGFFCVIVMILPESGKLWTVFDSVGQFCCLLTWCSIFISVWKFDWSGVRAVFGFNRCSTSGATLRTAAEPTPTTTATNLASSTAHVRRRTTTSAGNTISARPACTSAIFLRRHVGDVIFDVAGWSPERADRNRLRLSDVGMPCGMIQS